MGETATNIATATLIGEPRVRLDISASDAGKLRELLGRTSGADLYETYQALARLGERIPFFSLKLDESIQLDFTQDSI
ncbi:hypothetical protein GNX71_18445 [Variovorax sp. RKNM96]|uniref:hypothetical protein n=1 Tax=Variovorax sp. RKNM96 TaxID=2681552 RepID=UPI001981711F|nr:hypothetical protein [Variovorax sp. RKNM96]QSI31450.1 hypothetical protein GNX71_18445 [Variovorax sp. RKNM96]